MRFLFLTQYYPPEIGAPQTRLKSMGTELVKLGHQVEVVTALPNHPTGQIFSDYRGKFYVKETIDQLTVHRVWLYAANGAGVKRIFNYSSFVLTCFIGLFRCQKPDYIFVESPPLFLSVPAYLMSLIWKRPFIFNVADLWPDSAKKLDLLKEGLIFRLLSRLEKWTYRKALFVNAVTEGVQDILLKEKNVPKEKVLFLPNGVDTDLFDLRKKNEEIAERFGLLDKKVVLYAGTHGFAHGIEVALEAASYLEEREDIVFVFVGDGSEKKKLVRKATEMKLSNVLFFDPVPLNVIADLYSIASIGLSTLRNSSLFEATRPVKIYPAMASGIPILYSGSGEGARLVEQYESGMVVPPEDPKALAAAVLKLVDDEEYRKKLGKNGRRFVEAHLSWGYIVNEWLNQLLARVGDSSGL